MHYQIFIPSQTGGTNLLESVGLADHVEGAECRQVNAGSGPHELGGTLFAWPRAGQPWGVNDEKQTWIPCAEYHVGVWNDSPPVPGDLLRRRPHRGAYCKLGDGNQWLIPAWQQLPRNVVLLPDGTTTLEVKPKYLPLWEAAEYWGRKFGGVSSPFSFLELSNFCILLLRLNYRIAPELTGHLELFDTENLAEPLGTFLGVEISLGINSEVPSV